MRKKVLVGLVVGLVLVAGGLYASNMAFKLNYTLFGTDQTVQGFTTLGLPYNQQTNLVNAFDLLNDIGGTAVVAQIQRFNPQNNGVVAYSGLSGTPFPIVPAEGYLVQLRPGVATRSYIIVGSHDPSKVVVFDGAGTNGSLSGFSFYSHPYHAISNDASALLNELGGTAAIAQIQRFNPADNSISSYNGLSGTPFALVPGSGYYVQLRPGVPSVQFIPAHY